MLVPLLVTIYIKGLDGVIKCKISKLSDDIKLGIGLKLNASGHTI